MGGRAGGGARSGGGGGGARNDAYNVGMHMLTTTQKDFDDLAKMTYGSGKMSLKAKANALTQSAKAKLKANGWTYNGRFKQWESPAYSTYGEWTNAARKLTGSIK